MKARILLVAVAAILAACGGGGGGSTPSTPPPPSAPPPTLSISLSQDKAQVGTTVVVNWTSTNTTSCTGSDGLTGALQASGTQSVTPTSGGQFKFTVSCTGSGGSITQIATLKVPHAVLPTSYLNAKTTGVGPQDMPSLATFRNKERVTAGHQYGDFFQDGTYSMIAATNVFDATGEFGSTTTGKIFFFKKVGTSWVDGTAELLSDQSSCISPRKVIVADFNGDKKPDAFIACTGIEGKIAPGQTSGETSRFIMSQPNGKYTNTVTNFKCYCHSASAADFSGQGYADLVVTDTVYERQPFMLINNRDGTFTKSVAGLPQETAPVFNLGREIYTIEFIDIDYDGTLDLFVSGAEYDGQNQQIADVWFTPTAFKGTGNRTFTTKLGSIAANSEYSVVIDVVVKQGKIAVLRTNSSYTKMGVQILDSATFNQISFTQITNKDTVWMTLMNGNIVGAFTNNPYTITW